MPYWDIVTRSFRISWNHKYLWLIALFSGEAGGFNFNYSQQSSTTNRNPDLGRSQQQFATWFSDHLGLVIAIAVVWIVLVVAFFILAAVCEGATVRASAEHDAERPFGLRLAWRMGVHIFLPIYLVVAGFLAAQGSTYWTLAFRRMDVDYGPAFAYPAPSPTPSQ